MTSSPSPSSSSSPSSPPPTSSSTPSPSSPEPTGPSEPSGPAPKPRLTQKQAKRAGQSPVAMIVAVLATLAVVLVVMMLNPASTEQTYERSVDVPAAAEQATATAEFTALAPAVPEDWSANFARWNAGGTDQVEFWEAGYLTGDNTFAGFKQTTQANPTWLSQQIANAPATGTRAVDGVSWQLHEPDEGHRHLVGELDGTTVIISGSAELEDLDTLARTLQEASA